MNDRVTEKRDAAGDPPLAERVISDVESLKALSDPVRLRILETMVTAADAAWTVKRLAAALGVGPTKLYHHVGILEEHAFIRLAGTRVVSGIIEKSYRITQLSIRLDRSLLSGAGDTDSPVRDVLGVIFDSVRDDIEAALRSGLVQTDEGDPLRELVIRGLARLSPERAAELRERLRALIEEFDTDTRDAAPEDRPFGYLLALYPFPTPVAEPGDAQETTDG